MLVVKLDIHPLGDSRDAHTIRTVWIANSLKQSRKTGKYRYEIWVDGPSPAGFLPKHRKKPDLIVWHLRDAGAEVLVSKALAKVAIWIDSGKFVGQNVVK
jgi:hypothetical protein